MCTKHRAYSNIQIANGNEGKNTGIMCMMGGRNKEMRRRSFKPVYTR